MREQRELPEPVCAWGLLRLQPGALAAFSQDTPRLSPDEGRSCGAGRPIEMLGSP